MEPATRRRAGGRGKWLGLLLLAACGDPLVVGYVGRPDGGRPVLPAAGGDSERLPVGGEGAGGEPAADSMDAGPTAVGGDAALDPAPSSRDLGTVRLEPGTLPEFCGNRGLPLRSERPAGVASDCSPSLARKLFSYALCACDEFAIGGSPFNVDSFDSSRGPYRPGETGAAVGVNGTFTQLASEAELSGSLFVVGAIWSQIEGVSFGVAGDFKTNAKLEASTTGTRVGRDLWAGGDILASITVGRDAFQLAGATGIGNLNVGGQAHAASEFRLQPPCGCDGAPLVDVPAIVSQARSDNDNTEVGFAADSLRAGFLTTAADPLPCGRLYATGISNELVSTAAILAPGRTALFIDGDLTTAPITTATFAATSGGELDVFINGDIQVGLGSSLWLGDVTRPAATRIYVAGQIEIAGYLFIEGAQLYAPNATLDMFAPGAETVESYGSIVARAMNWLGSYSIHYDRQILNVDPECSAPAPQRCDGCHQCPGELACVAGTCAACTGDGDCCSPTVCSAGRCVPL